MRSPKKVHKVWPVPRQPEQEELVGFEGFGEEKEERLRIQL